jgi:tetratricopeptide (TPR) repeat protein
MKRFVPTGALALCLLLVACQSTNTASTADFERGGFDTAYGHGVPAQLFPDMGPYTRPITTDSRTAQRYFDQGMKWMFGFNHDEAVRSFTKAAELDPSCAMAWWGVACAQGPNYNASGMNDARQAAAWEATEKALAALDDETPVERALVNALQTRFKDPADEEDKRNQNQMKADYAEALAEVYAQYPDDADVATFYAEALMLKRPWRLWNGDGSAKDEEVNTIVEALERAMQLSPGHPGADHFYIHTVEASKDKMRGIPAADRLSTAVPLAGHLVHMPSHLYVQVGMWDRAVEQNLLAIDADERYFERSPMQFRVHGYSAHNGHMLAFAAMMIGREEDAMRGAEWVWHMPDDVMETMGRRYDRAMCGKYDVLRRFGRWDELLAEPAPPSYLRQTTALWRACRAIAFAAKKDFDNAKAEHAAFRVFLDQRPKDRYLLLNDRFVAAEIALQQEKWDEAIKLLEEAAGYEDGMGYGEPPRWVQPVRHTLGVVLLKAERYADAERVYREDLEAWPGNGWSLFGLAQALEAQGRDAEALAVRAAFDQAWAGADHPIQSSCKCVPTL